MDNFSSLQHGTSQIDENSPAPVAIIAIHGVGRHASGASAEAVADLLLSMGREDGDGELQGNQRVGRPYSGFTTTSIEVPLRKVESPAPVELLRPFVFAKPEDVRRARNKISNRPAVLYVKNKLVGLWQMFDERRGFLADQREAPGLPAAPAAPQGEGERRELRQPELDVDRGLYAYEFMRTQLVGYKGDVDRTFTTPRLEVRREPNSPAVPVHLYDAHYSDLNKPESSTAAFFFSFYQLLFHLGSLSLQSVYWAEAENAGVTEGWRRWGWRIFASVHATSVRSFVMVIPLLNLILLALGLCAFAEKIPSGTSNGILIVGALAVFGVLGVIGSFLFGRVRPTSRRPILWALLPAGGIAAGVLALGGASHLLWWALYRGLPEGLFLVVIAWLITAFALVTFIYEKLGTVRQGAFQLGVFFFACNAAAFLYFLRKAEGYAAQQHVIAVSSLWSAQLVFAELRLFWILFLASAILSALIGWLCVLLTQDPDRKARARAAIRTSRLTIAVSAAVFLLVTVVLWAGLVKYATDKLKVFDQVPHVIFVPRPLDSPKLAAFVPDIQGVEKWTSSISPALLKSPHQWDSFLTGLLLMSFTAGLPVTLLFLLLGTVLLVWAVLPSLLYELMPEWTIKENVTNLRMQWLANWLSRGLDSTAIVARLAWFAIVPVPLLFGALDYLMRKNILPANYWLTSITMKLSESSLLMVQGIGVTLAVSGAAIVTLLLKYGTTVVDTLLDVDNYLRTSPAEQTPRARITERYVSIFRYIAGYRDPFGRPYSRLIIVAHSLGSNVSTDLLLYLKHSASIKADPELAPFGFEKGTPQEIPIFLFTMGSPLRQLLNRFFPYPYLWISDKPDNSCSTARLGDAVRPPIPPAPSVPLPNPAEIGVTGWVNAYRSGDYVGRSLWLGSWFSRNATGGTSPAWKPAADISPSARSGGTVAEMCVGIGAHTHYWDRTAPDVATALDRLITNPPGVFP